MRAPDRVANPNYEAVATQEATPPAPTKKKFNLAAKLVRAYDALLGAATVINAVGNGAIASNAGKNMAAVAAGGVSATCNSLSQADAAKAEHQQNPSQDNPLIQLKSYQSPWKRRYHKWIFSWFDPSISLIYGFGCGATTAASAFLVLNAFNAAMGGIPSLVFISFILGSISLSILLSNKSIWKNKWRLAGAIGISVLVAVLFGGISALLISFAPAGVALIPSILSVSSYILCCTIGLSTTLVNTGMTLSCITDLFLGKPGDREDRPKLSTVNSESEMKEEAITKKREARIGWILIPVMCSCIAYGLAIGGLTGISIMAIPLAFGVVAPALPMLITAIIVSVITAAAMIPLMYTSSRHLVHEIPRQLSGYLGRIAPKFNFNTEYAGNDTLWNWFKFYCRGLTGSMFIFNFMNDFYLDTPRNRFKFYLRTTLLTLIAPAIITTGSVMTLIQACDSLGKVILEFFRLVKFGTEDDSLNISKSVLGAAFLADFLFALQYGMQLAVKISDYFLQIELSPIKIVGAVSANPMKEAGQQAHIYGEEANKAAPPVVAYKADERTPLRQSFMAPAQQTAAGKAPVLIIAAPVPDAVLGHSANNKSEFYALAAALTQTPTATASSVTISTINSLGSSTHRASKLVNPQIALATGLVGAESSTLPGSDLSIGGPRPSSSKIATARISLVAGVGMGVGAGTPTRASLPSRLGCTEASSTGSGAMPKTSIAAEPRIAEPFSANLHRLFVADIILSSAKRRRRQDRASHTKTPIGPQSAAPLEGRQLQHSIN